MIKFTETTSNQTIEITLKDFTDIDDTVQAFVYFLRATGYVKSTIADALYSTDIVSSYLDENEESADGDTDA